MSHQNVQARREDIPLMPLGSSSSPQSTVNRAAKRTPSEASPRCAPSFQPRGKQAPTSSGHRQTPAQLGIASSSNPSVLKMGREVSPGPSIGDVRHQFSDMDKRIRAFSQTMADRIVQSNTLPSPAAQSSPLPGNSPVGKPAHEFPSLGDYIFFALLSIINTRMCEVIFEPFHPAASPQKNARYTEEYSAMIASQKELGLWRSQKFSSIDSQVGPDRVATLILEWTGSIHNELAQVLESLTGPVSVPESFVSDLHPILKTAYAWNSIVKRDFLAYDLKPFVVKPSERWDPERMRLFEPLRGRGRGVRRDSGVVSSVSLGIYRSVSQGSEGRVLSVEQTAKVLVEEWFPSGRGAGEQCNILRNVKGSSQVQVTQPRSTGPIHCLHRYHRIATTGGRVHGCAVWAVAETAAFFCGAHRNRNV